MRLSLFRGQTFTGYDALMARFASQGQADYGNRLLAMMRNAFGGHAVKAE